MLSLTTAAPRLFIAGPAARSLERHLQPFRVNVPGQKKGETSTRPAISPAGFGRILALWVVDTAWQEAFDALCQRHRYVPCEPVRFGDWPCDCPWTRDDFAQVWQERLDRHQERILFGPDFLTWTEKRGLNPSTLQRFGVDEDAGAFVKIVAKADGRTAARLEAFVGFFSLDAIRAPLREARWQREGEDRYLMERCLRLAHTATGTAIRLGMAIFPHWLLERNLRPETEVPFKPHLAPASARTITVST